MSNLNTLKAKRGLVKGALTRAASYAETVDVNVPLEMLQIRLTKLEEDWSEFMSLQNQLCDLADNPDFVNPETEIAEYESKYFIAQSTLANFIHLKEISASPRANANESVVEKLATQQATFLERLNATNHTSSSSASLPKITIPSFSGADYKDWPAFRDLFISSVDCNASLTCTQKFYFLKSSLTGDALKLIQSITISDNNYIEAWEKLEKRYDRSHLIVQSYVQSYLSLPSIKSSNVSLLRKITDGADEAIRGLNASGSNSRDPWLIYLLLQKLDPDTNEAWAHHIGSKDDSTINELLDFLQDRCVCLESCFSSPRSIQIQSRSKPQGVIRSHLIESKQVCPKCKADHGLFSCKGFLSLSIDSRRNFAKEHSLCFNCLRAGHNSSKCRSNYRCKTCKSKHHTLVHLNVASETPNINFNPETNSHASSSSSVSNIEQPVVNNHSCEPHHRLQAILPTAVVKTTDRQNSFQLIRLLLDTGSQVSFISEAAVQGLGLVRQKSRIPVLGVGSTPAGYTNGVVSLRLVSRVNSRYIDVTCHVLSKLTSLLPPTPIENTCFSNLDSFELADPKFYQPGPIDVVIGVDQVFNIITGTSCSQENGLPNLVPTIFGSVVAGNSFKNPNELKTGLRIHCAQVDDSQDFDIEKFWRLEEVNFEPVLSLEDQRVEDLFVSTHSRLPSGRYMVKLPFKTNESTDYGDSLGMALNRLHATERKFSSNPSLRDQYQAFMQEYLALGHMEEVPPTEVDRPSDKCYYLPHHAVFKEDSSTTKIRVVFDGSAKTHNFPSLNDSLLAGPTISKDIFTVTLRFRRHKFAISGDAEKMYRQIRISPEQADFQRIVWRDSPNHPVRHYRLLTVTYGTKPASYLAVRTLKQLAIDSSKTHPLAAAAVLEDSYIDDVPTGANTVEEAIELHSQLVDLFKSGGFNLRKWTTNCWPVLMNIPDEQREMSPIEFEESSSVKILGLFWCPSKDCFSYRVKLDPTTTYSKRGILSDASRVFDPLGFLAPVTVAMKILLQDLWRENLGWDKEIHKDLADRWTIIRNEMPFIEELRIPRTLWVNKDTREFHGFCDASLDAYAAVVYCRSVDSNGNINVMQVAAKSRVAPIKVVSLPKLELCGALLLSRLVSKLKISFQEKDIKVFAWTDSKIVLHWLSAPPKTWSVFVANRTSEILSSISFNVWNHVRSASNPADCATRGISPSSLPSNELWWKGPSWLWQEKIHWPDSTPPIEELPAVLAEKRKHPKPQVLTSSIDQSNVFEELVCKSSNWIRCLRVVALMKRFIFNSRSVRIPRPRNCKPLSSSELSEAKIIIIKIVQMSLFPSVIVTLQKGNQLPSKNKLSSLAPFLDPRGILRVGGRLQASELSYDAKHPIILCKTHSISNLLVKYYHRHYLHAGVTLMFAMIKQNFYILGCRNLLRKAVHQCTQCFRQRKASSIQFMGDLPKDRIRFQRPFSKVGCDYAGPITLRLSRGRNPRFVKAYIALFVCFVTKGIHLELVGDLTSNSFLMALDRFCARRGKPAQIWSDNGTNFHGARRILNEMYECLLSQQHQNIVIDHLSKDNIDWKFLPPSSPHFGGLWEAGVKSVKQHLRRTIGDHVLTYEEMYTLLTKIESLLNSRPMWATSDTEPCALTPSHFMIGEPLSTIPQPNSENSTISISTNWYLLQSMMQGFWKRWHLEYLTSLQQRQKWKTPQPNLAIDDVVLLKEPNLPPSKWILGRITQTHQGNDGKVRVVTVRTKFGEYTRPIVKVAPLPAAERPKRGLSGGAECSEMCA